MDPKYLSILDLVNGSANIKEIDEKNFDIQFVYIEEPIEFYTVESKTLDRDLRKLDEYYQNNDLSLIVEKVAEIEGQRLIMDDNRIHNGKYNIEYGTYVYSDNIKITLKKDNSAIEDDQYHGSYYVQYNKIIAKIAGAINDREFIIIDNNRIQKLNNNQILNLEKLIYLFYIVVLNIRIMSF